MPDSGTLCADMCPSDRRKGGILALTSRRADLQKYESLDTRPTYLDQCCFRSSEARSVDHARAQLRKPGRSRYTTRAWCTRAGPRGPLPHLSAETANRSTITQIYEGTNQI